MKVSSCVTFFGNCRKAIDFYTEIFQLTEVKVLTFGDRSDSFDFDLPPKCEDLIYRAELNIKSNDSCFSMIMGDSPVLVFDTGINLNPNNRDNISYEISSKDKEWIEKTYNKFLEEGKRNTPLEKKKGEYELSGSVIDKFGICWILNCL